MKILVIQTRPGIGDMCIFLPFIHEIAKIEKKKVTILTKKRSSTNYLVKNDPYIEEVIYIPDKFDLNFIKNLRSKKFSKSFIFHYGIKFILLSYLCNIRQIFSYDFIKKNKNISIEPKKNLQKWFGIENLNYECKIFFPKNHENENNIIIGIGGSGPTKKWKIENYLNLMIKLNEKHLNSKFIIAGGKDDIFNYEFLENNFIKNKLISLCNLNIEEAINHMTGSKIYIGNDTGFMHISASLGVKTFGLFGDTPTNYAEYNKLITPIIPKGYIKIEHNSRAINQIDVDWVLENIN